MIPIYIAFLWHMHQPVYWPGETVMQTQSAGHYGFSVLGVHLDRSGPYTAWPVDAVEAAMGAGLGSCGAQVSFTGSLVENLDAIEAAGAGFSRWKDRWRQAAAWTTVLGNPRVDLVNIGYFHPLMPLVHPEDVEVQIGLHRVAVERAFPGTAPSRGLFPPETGFDTGIIPAAAAAGVEWVIVDNIHFDRTLPAYPWSAGGNLVPPNKADQRSSASPSWVSLGGVWAPTRVSAPWGYQPHWVSYRDPSTGALSRVVAVPAARYEGNEDGRGGFGALSYDAVLSQLAAANTDPLHPILVVLHHDGDNYGGGSDAYYHANFDAFLSWVAANPDRFACTTVQDYLDRFPPDPADEIHVEPGSWSGADNGDPEFGKWNGEPGADGYSPDRSSWAVITAARGRVAHAAALRPWGTLEAILDAAPGNPSARAMRWLMLAETSCYWYWDNSAGGVWDSHPSRAALRATAEADPVIAAAPGSDPVGPTIHAPGREPYNPGEREWGPDPEPARVEVSTFIYDTGGVASATLRWRRDDDGVIDARNMVYAAGGWCDLPMEETPMTSRADPAPGAIASMYTAALDGVENAFVDYYVEARDGAGNVSASPIRHAWVGSGGGTSPGGLVYYPLAPTKYDVITVLSPRAGKLHWGINGWHAPPAAYWPAGTVDWGDGKAVETPMADGDGDTLVEAAVGPWTGTVAVTELDFVFHYGDGTWSGADNVVAVDGAPGAAPHVFVVAPRGGEVSGSVAVRATASDAEGISVVRVYVDGALVGEDAAAPYAVDWDTTAAADGAHTLRVVATDTGGAAGEATVEVRVRNGAAPECVIGTDVDLDAIGDAPMERGEAPEGTEPVEQGEDRDGGDAGEQAADGGDAASDAPPRDGGSDAGGGERGGGSGGCGCAVAR